MFPRFFLNAQLAIGDSIVLSQQVSRHVQVLRLNIDSIITLFNGTGGEFLAKIFSLNKNIISVKILEFIFCERELLQVKITIAPALAADAKIDSLIEKATALGVSAIMPLYTARCVVHLNKQRATTRLDRWRNLASSSCEQCGRNQIPDISLAKPLHEWLKSLQKHELESNLIVLLLPNSSKTLSQSLKAAQSLFTSQNTPKVTVIIGPEGGFSSQEEDLIINYGAIKAKLGSRILRCETAAVTAIAAICAFFEEI